MSHCCDQCTKFCEETFKCPDCHRETCYHCSQAKGQCSIQGNIICPHCEYEWNPDVDSDHNADTLYLC